MLNLSKISSYWTLFLFLQWDFFMLKIITLSEKNKFLKIAVKT